MTRKRAKSKGQTSFGTPGTTETSGAALRNPPMASQESCRLLSSTPFQSSPGGMSVQSTSADCQIPLRRGSQARSLSEERSMRARF
jgi:hypothetical protein